MEGFTIIDGVVAVVIILSALLAYGRGFVREAMAIAGWIAAAILAFLFAPRVEPLVREIPVIGDFIADSCELSIIGAFALVFAVALIVVSLFTPSFPRSCNAQRWVGSTRAWAFSLAWRAASCSLRLPFSFMTP